eukprot:TRINITY_DN136_c0_g1_i3.p1 TRINITY_DN136_c0_g1~~TRINITY_DN136_c0_g1_i3.p1  ORF type:complete len:456 (+),score=169.32 TRINITY_DN136_c0_g1_i3:74-1369(+)
MRWQGALLFAAAAAGRVLNFEQLGGVPDDDSSDTQWKNGALANATFNNLTSGDTLIFPAKTFHMMGGITAHNIRDVVIRFDGTISFSDDMKHWPTRPDGKRVLECMSFYSFTNVTFTSATKGTLNGNGKTWWGIPGIGYLQRQENRPRLFYVHQSKDILVEKILFLNSPYWTVWIDQVDGLEIRWCDIDARRDHTDGHNIYDITAFNTDGYDVTGKNVWIHDCTVWNQDDCVAVKDGSENMLIERINASGVGLTIGSIGSGSVVRNITFRDSYMHNSYKGIYMKFRALSKSASISDITYENIVMDSPSQWPIWIGPAQQSDSVNLCAAHPCSICWPDVPFTKCDAPSLGTYANITLRNITVNNPKMSPGVLLADASNPMVNVVFDNVVINNPGDKPWGDDYYKCENVQGVATGTTNPVPPCFKDMTVNAKK